jgi:hypothetical protein
VAVSVPPKESYLLYVATNPVEACRVSLYKEHFVRTPDGWIPDRLTELHRLPDFGAMPDPEDGLEAQNTRVYLLDLWIPPDVRPGRFRLEVQLKVAGWIIRPMEVRVVEARIPDLPDGVVVAPAAIERGADATAVAVVGAYLYGTPPTSRGKPLTVRDIIRRNAAQDMALAASAGIEWQPRLLDLLKLNGAFRLRPLGAEWFLRVRDSLLK